MEEILVNKMCEQIKKMGAESLLALDKAISEAFCGLLGSDSLNNEGIRPLADFHTHLSSAISDTIYELSKNERNK